MPDGTPVAPAEPAPEEVTGAETVYRHVRNVHAPSITVYRPAAGAKGRPALIVAPGGGYGVLALD